jgi:hypothetical protein
MDVRELIRDDDAGAGYNEVRGIGWLRARVLLESKASRRDAERLRQTQRDHRRSLTIWQQVLFSLPDDVRDQNSG